MAQSAGRLCSWAHARCIGATFTDVVCRPAQSMVDPPHTVTT